MTKLISRQPKRIFSFGCSFTEYYWGGTWPEIIAKDLNIPLYNYGKSGAGNQYIANMVSQADSFFNFNEDDLVIISWTNVCREDKWANRNWVTPGNIFTQDIYDKKYVGKWADPVGYLIRDLSSIKLVESLLKNSKCQYHFIAMCDIEIHVNQNNLVETYDKNTDIYNTVCELYRPQLDSIEKGFFTTLWDGNIYNNKLLPDQEIFGRRFSDGHPTPKEHLTYLQKTFEHDFKEETLNAVEQSTTNLINFIREMAVKKNKQFAIYELSANEINTLKELTKITVSNPVKLI